MGWDSSKKMHTRNSASLTSLTCRWFHGWHTLSVLCCPNKPGHRLCELKLRSRNLWPHFWGQLGSMYTRRRRPRRGRSTVPFASLMLVMISVISTNVLLKIELPERQWTSVLYEVSLGIGAACKIWSSFISIRGLDLSQVHPLTTQRWWFLPLK